MKTIGKPAQLKSYFPIYDSSQGKFTSDPDSVIGASEDYIVIGRDISNIFTIYNIQDFSRIKNIKFHKVFLYI